MKICTLLLSRHLLFTRLNQQLITNTQNSGNSLLCSVVLCMLVSCKYVPSMRLVIVNIDMLQKKPHIFQVKHVMQYSSSFSRSFYLIPYLHISLGACHVGYEVIYSHILYNRWFTFCIYNF